ncbi:hypothetical protein [Ornithinimicrobium avium]|uniref:Uncharacterized protein n=1 Tax=Ornithinimicrobium avium TaxID=2283195 RepID=A0A345NKE4_9MICO|nr:hypothetical protein [Ornithinimicrobium avium]AXH95502.1 hypothetical protein DV701_04580 [Ornithinimicrobium avium]
MTVRLLAISGLNLDRAWPDEAPEVGKALRDTSAGLLLELVQRTLDLQVDALAVLGGLWDPSTVRSSTVDDVRAVLKAVPVPVVVLPDAAEAETGFRPHTLTTWPGGVHWVGGDATVEVEAGTGRVVAQGPLGYSVPSLDDALALLTTRAGGGSASCPTVRPAAGRSDQPHPNEQPGHPAGVVEVPPLVAGSGTGRPVACVVTLDAGADARAEHVELSPAFGTVRTLDVGEHADVASLTAALDERLAASAPLDRVVVAGRVGPRVLVPPALSWEPSRTDVTVVWRDLEHVFPEAPTERTVQAELIRRLAGPGADLSRRHQALALGLASLDSEEATA